MTTDTDPGADIDISEGEYFTHLEKKRQRFRLYLLRLRAGLQAEARQTSRHETARPGAEGSGRGGR